MDISSGLPDIFEEVCTYFDNIPILIKLKFADHLMRLNVFLQKIWKAGLKLKAVKITFASTDTIEYLRLKIRTQKYKWF